MYEFISRFAPHLTKELIDQAYACHSNKAELDAVFEGIELPTY